MGLWSLLTRMAAARGGTQYGARIAVEKPRHENDPRTLYAIQRAYYAQNGLYETLAELLKEQGIWKEAMKPLRNPAYRAVEFYPAHLWAGELDEALPLVSENERIVEPIRKVWRWSNWGTRKSAAMRSAATCGDLFLKVAQSEDRRRVYIQNLRPEVVTAMQADERGHLTMARLDVESASGGRLRWRTELWDKAGQSMQVWLHDRALASIEQLGEPTEVVPFAEFGIDFIPIVHAPFRDIGEERGIGAFTLQLDKIDEANRSASRLHQMLFRNNTVFWALQANGTDKMGRPFPPPRLDDDVGESPNDDPNVATIGDDRMYRLPGNATLTPLVPPIKYVEALEVLRDQMGEIEKDLPELTWHRLRDAGELSGRAVRLMLADAIAKAIEARANLEAGLARADAMALTIGQVAGIEGFAVEQIGTYQGGDFEHTFAPRDVLPADDKERAETMKLDAEARTYRKGLGVSDRQNLEEMGYDAAAIERMARETRAQAEAAAADALRAFENGGADADRERGED